MSDKQYSIILDLFHEMHEEFHRLSEQTKTLFFARLHGA